MPHARDLIEKLGLAPHPEGGWYRETWRAPPTNDIEGNTARSASTAISFLLTADEQSHWHAVDADEIWVWQGGDPLELRLAADGQTLPETVVLGPAELVATGEEKQTVRLMAVVSAGCWQAARPVKGAHGYALVACVVAPGFDFAGFTLAPPGWEPRT